MVVTFPHMGNLFVSVKYLCDELNLQYIIPPFYNKRTLELGTRYTPEGACLPLKLTIGNFIEAYEQGADTVLMVGGKGPCRFGYYCEMQQEILHELGIKMEVITLEAPNGNIKTLLNRINRIAMGTKPSKILRTLYNVTRFAIQTDEIEQLCFKTRSLEIKKGSTDEVYRTFKNKAMEALGADLQSLLNDTKKRLLSIPLNQNYQPLKVGIVGEIYGNIDPFMKFFLEDKLGSMGVEVHRYITISEWIVEHMIKKELHLPRDKSYAKAAKPYLKTMIGGHAQETIGHTVMYAEQGYDGVIQLYPLGCMPEIVAQSILPTVSNELNIPVLTLIIDEMTGEAGYTTRVEAFIDLLWQRRKLLQRTVDAI